MSRDKIKQFFQINFRIFILILLILIPLYLLIIINVKHQQNGDIESAQQRAGSLARIIYLEQKNQLDNAKQILLTLSVIPDVKNMQASSCQHLFAEIIAEDNYFDNIVLVNTNGQLICSTVDTNSDLDFREKEFFIETIETKSFGVGDYDISAITNKKSVNIGYPVLNNNDQIVGVIYVNIDLQWFDELYKQMQLPKNSAIVLFNEKGEVIIRYPQQIELHDKFNESPIYQSIQSGINEQNIIDVGVDGVRRIYSYERADDLDLYFTVGFSEEEIVADANNIFKGNLIILIYITVLVMVISLFAGRFLLANYIKKLQSLNEAKDTFISVASHQLVTPITAMRWTVEMLLEKKDNLTASQQEYLKTLAEMNLRMKDLISALLNVARIDTGTFSVNISNASVTELVKDVVKELKPQVEEKNIRLKEKYHSLIPQLPVDKELLHIVFDNVIANAVKYTPQNGEVNIEIKKIARKEIIDKHAAQHESILISVSDTGIGIPEKQQRKIFSKMYRAVNAQENKISGTGLGLYVAKSIIDIAGGQIWFTSKEGVGTTFFILIPLAGMKNKKGNTRLS